MPSRHRSGLALAAVFALRPVDDPGEAVDRVDHLAEVGQDVLDREAGVDGLLNVVAGDQLQRDLGHHA